MVKRSSFYGSSCLWCISLISVVPGADGLEIELKLLRFCLLMDFLETTCCCWSMTNPGNSPVDLRGVLCDERQCLISDVSCTPSSTAVNISQHVNCALVSVILWLTKQSVTYNLLFPVLLHEGPNQGSYVCRQCPGNAAAWKVRGSVCYWVHIMTGFV